MSPAIRQWGWGRCTRQAQYERRGGRGSCLAEEGEVPYMKGQLYDLLNSELRALYTIDYNDFKCKNLGGLKPPPPSLSILSLI